MFRSVKCVLLLFFVFVSFVECKIKRKSRSPKDELGKSSLAFVFDVTGSMQNDLRQLREGAEMILNTALKESNVIADFVFVPFHDPAVGPATVTRSKKVFKQALSAVHVYGGGDCPEKSLTGIQLALNVSRPRSFLYVFTDATAGDHRTVAKVLDEIQNKQSQVVFILTGHCNDLDKPSYKVYQQIAAASSGQIFNLKKASVHKMLEFVKSSIKGRTVNLASATNPAGYNYSKEIPVDSTLGEVTVSVSGAKPRITVVDPKGEELKGPPKLVTTLDLSEIMVVKVMQPETGNYLITVGSAEDYSVKVVGLSNLTFNHGFSVHAPKSMQETSYRPLKGAYNHMQISVTETNVTVDVQYAEILTLDGRTLFEVPLKEVDSIKKVYAAEPFIPPDEFFYIAINGRDQHNQELRRIGTTAVQPKSPDVPHLTAPQRVQAHSHSRVVLTCKVESLVPFAAMWTKDTSIINQQTTSLHTTSLDVVIEDMKEDHVGTYSCVARNVAGINKATTELTITVDAPQVSIEPHNTTVEAGSDVTITCTVYSEALLLENKLLFNGTRTYYAIDLNKEPSLEGLYTYKKKLHVSENVTGKYSCVAANRGGKTKQSTHIKMKRNPTAQILGPHTLSKVINSDLQLVCAVDNANLVVWRGPNNTALRSVVVNGTHNDVLSVRNVASDGTWTCTALRGSMKGSDSVKVSVLIKPVVQIVGEKNITVLNGSVVEVTCLVEAKPAPRILWHRETETFLNNTITAIKPTVYQSVLTLNSSAESVNGTYFCFGENTEGIHHDSVTVNVRRKMTLIKGFTDQAIQLYNQTELHCVVDSYPIGITHWYHNGTSLVPNVSVQISDDNTTVYLMKVDFNDLGEYVCEVENEYEKMEVKGTVSVEGLARPVLYNEVGNLTTNEGHPAIITCRILEGSPEPKITWQYRITGSFEFSTRLKGVVISDDRFELSIPKVNKDHAGIYRCWAHNVVGEDFYDVTLVVQYPPKLLNVTKDSDKPQTVKLGESVRLSCEASGTPPPLTVWTKHGRALIFTDHLSLSNTSELVIAAASADDSGTYTCNVTNVAGSTHRNYTLLVYDPPTILSTPTPPREVLQGSLMELPCDAKGLPAPLVHWTLNGAPIEKEKYVEGYGLRFVVNVTDSGLYTCSATNEHGTATVSYKLSVLEPPKFLNNTKDSDKPQTVKLGESVRLSCEASGTPPPLTVWTKHGRALIFTDHLYITKNSELVIAAASASDSGTFTCTATNAAGAIHRNFTLSVYDPPKLLESTKVRDEQRKVKLGETVRLSCEASGTPPPLTVWTKHGRALIFSDHLYLTNNSELVIDTASAYDAGTYTCNVTSSVGSTHRNFTLDVYYPPTISESQSESLREVLEGQLVELPCAARGVPTPIVEWTLNEEPISHEKYLDEHGLRFVANLTDFGEYTCTATNIHGNASISYTLHVWVPPYIKPHSTIVKEALVGSNVTLQCDVIGFPLPTLQWKFNEELLEENTTDVSFNEVGNIYVTNTQLEHEGTYTCLAHNLGGADERSIYLKVNEPPKIMEDNYTGPYVATDSDTALSIACRSTGKPTPYYTWVKDGFYLNRDVRYSVEVDGTLHMRSPSADMSGRYTCRATNRAGADYKTVAVLVYSLPKITQSEEKPSVVTVEEGSDAVIECPVRAFSHSLKWYKNAKLIATGPLRLYKVSRDNATTYFCVAANAVGSAHSKVQLVVEWPPTFLQQEKQEIESLKGDDAYLHCDVDAKPSAKTKWLLNSKTLVFEDKSYLKLMNVQLGHAGSYKCIVSNVHGTLVRDFVLKVLEPPFISDFDMMDVQLKEGDNATLECNARGTPPPNITWTYSNPHWHVEGTSLWSSNMSGESGGLFRCDATSRAGSTHLVYRVSVVTAARVEEIVAYMNGEGTTVGKTLELVRGSNVRVACKASGNPVPDIQWLRQGRPVSQNRYDIHYADLTLATVDPTHKGLYTCVASNEGGSDDRRITMDVLEPPKIFQSLFEATHSSEVHLEVISGQSYYLHCHPYGNPFPEVYWFRDDVPLKLFDDKMVSTEFGEVIVVKEASEEQSGNYTCVARNKVGNTSVTYLVDVLVPPKSPKESSRKVVATFGNELVLDCPSMGTRPNVMWIKHPYTEINADNRISFADDNFTMIINKTVVSDSGNYSCILTNKVGTTEVMFEVVVRKRPSIAGNVGTNIVEGHVVPLRRSIVLKCEVDGHPFPQITWLKDTQLLSDSVSNIQRVLGNSLLAIWSVQARDAGQYICLAESLAGSAHRRYNVAVQVPAKWSVWSSWSLCNVTCGLGHQTRSRLCQYTDERNNTYDKSSNSETIVLDESACKGPSEDRRKCHMPPCQEDSSKPRWSQWSQWSECSTTCGSGSRARTRKCKTKAKCVGDNVQIKKCTDLPSCRSVASSGDTDDFDSSEDISNSNPYIPDITFESEPEVIDSHYSPDVEEFYSASGAQSPTAFYDVEVKENLDGSVQGPCDPGYRHNIATNTCDDVDECSVEKNQCHPTQVCANTAGGYRCSCPPGYRALAAGHRCLDINECTLESAGCEFSCVNTAGGYVCACPRHLRLHLDKHHCVVPSLYRKPFDEIEPDYMSTTVDFPIKYTKYRNK